MDVNIRLYRTFDQKKKRVGRYKRPQLLPVIFYYYCHSFRLVRMSDLRKRQSSEGKVSQTNGKVEHVQKKAPTPSPTSFRLRAFLLLGSCALSAAWFIHNSGTTVLPEAYALCSREASGIYTVDDANSVVQCMVVSDSHIMDTGSLEDIKSRWGILNASSSPLHIRYIKDGSIVLPGLSDSHAHILEYGASRQLSLEGGKTIKDTVALVKRYILENADVQKDRSRVIEGWGWDHTSWPVEQWPHMDDFEKDPIVRGRSIILQSKDGHALWISPHVLNTSLPFPNEVEGGVIVRDEFRNPTGVLLDNAQELIQKPPLTEDDLLKRFAATVKDALANGLTSVHDAGLNPLSLAFFKRQVAAGNMPIRIYGMTFFEENGPYWGNLSKPIIGASNGRFSARSVKIFADGALRSGGAALFEPYHDNPETNGFMRLDPAVLYDVIPRFLSDGWQVNVHAIGDRANSIVLDAFESTLKNVNVTALRPRLEHAQILTEADMARVGKLGVIASIQPTHAISDMWYAEDRLGPERVKGLYAFRSLINHGARLALGSDFPVEDMNPLSGFYSAVTRLSFDGRSPHGTAGWFPDQRLTRQEALRGMTIDAAYASFTDSEVGSLVPGKRADYVVLSQDIMTVPVGQILDTKVFATAIDGRPVFGEI